MKHKALENNCVKINGKILEGFFYSHEIWGEKFYAAYVGCPRASGKVDHIPLMVSERLMDVTQNYAGSSICISGQFRSYNKREEHRNRLILHVFVREAKFAERGKMRINANRIYLDGYICKEPIYRKTPLGREIADLLLAVNRPYGKTDYIPCICWGRNALFASGLKVGDHCKISGRIQSREYQKTIGENELEVRTAYEVSANRIEVVESEENADERRS